MRVNRRVDVRVDHTGFGRQLWGGVEAGTAALE